MAFLPNKRFSPVAETNNKSAINMVTIKPNIYIGSTLTKYFNVCYLIYFSYSPSYTLANKRHY